jgi:hypothetical protein
VSSDISGVFLWSSAKTEPFEGVPLEEKSSERVKEGRRRQVGMGRMDGETE